MSHTKKEQLKNIIRKEYIDILKEVKINEAHFNHIAHKRVVKKLIEEGVLEENWQDRAVQRQIDQWSREELPEYGESWGDARARQGMERLPPQFSQAPSAEGSAFPAPENDPDVAVPDETSDSGDPVGGSFGQPPSGQTGLPTQYHIELGRIVTQAPMTFRKGLHKVGDEVYNALKETIDGETEESLAQLTVDIVDTVAQSMGTAGGRNWVAGANNLSQLTDTRQRG